MGNWDNIDICSLLSEQGFSYNEEGENISNDWIGMQCIFCEDSSNHLGINIYTGTYSCWRCGNKGHISKLLFHLLGNWKKAKEVAAKYTSKILYREDDLDDYSTEHLTSLESITKCSKTPNQFHIDYLNERGFDYKKLMKTYKIEFTDFMGSFRYRVIIPFYRRGRLLSFTGRDATNEQKIRYKHSPIKCSVVPPHDCLYNIDNARFSTVIVFEGPTDVWAFGDGTVSVQGHSFSHRQIRQLTKFREVIVGFDPDQLSRDKAEMMTNSITPFVERTRLLEFKSGDPASQEKDTIDCIRKEVFGRLY